MKLIDKALQMIKQAFISKVGDDDSICPTTDITYNSKISKAIRFSPYGLCTNAPLNSNVVLLSADGQESLKYALSDDMQNRFKNLKEGEVVLYNYISGSYIYLKENGDIQVECKNDEDINIVGDATIEIGGNGDITIGGDATVGVTGSLAATAGTTATITAPTINLTGNVVISGTLGVTGGSKATFSGDIEVTNDITAGEATINGIGFTTHVHGGVVAGGDDTGVAK